MKSFLRFSRFCSSLFLEKTLTYYTLTRSLAAKTVASSGHLHSEASVAKPNFQFEKRQRELEKKKKKEQKLQRKAQKKDPSQMDGEQQHPAEPAD